VKCIPFLPDTPRFEESLELHTVDKIMTRDVVTLDKKTTAGAIAAVSHCVLSVDVASRAVMAECVLRLRWLTETRRLPTQCVPCGDERHWRKEILCGNDHARPS